MTPLGNLFQRLTTLTVNLQHFNLCSYAMLSPGTAEKSLSPSFLTVSRQVFTHAAKIPLSLPF